MQDYDIVCISETKLDEIDELNVHINGFTPIYRHQREYKNKSGGIATLIRDDIFEHCTEIKQSNAECIQWIKINKKLLGYNLVIGNLYIPPVGTKYLSGDELDIVLEDMININAEYNCDFCVVGDCNVRTASLVDYVTLDPQISQEAGMDEESNFFISEESLADKCIQTKRVNSDHKSDKRGDELLTFCKITSILIVNGRVGRDKSVSQTTCEKITSAGLSIPPLTM